MFMYIILTPITGPFNLYQHLFVSQVLYAIDGDMKFLNSFVSFPLTQSDNPMYAMHTEIGKKLVIINNFDNKEFIYYFWFHYIQI